MEPHQAFGVRQRRPIRRAGAIVTATIPDGRGPRGPGSIMDATRSLRLFQEYVTLARRVGRIVRLLFVGESISGSAVSGTPISPCQPRPLRSEQREWWTRLGITRERAGENRYAAAAYERALSQDPHSPDAPMEMERARKSPFSPLICMSSYVVSFHTPSGAAQQLNRDHPSRCFPRRGFSAILGGGRDCTCQHLHSHFHGLAEGRRKSQGPP
jgi:hypothetical protein